MKIDHVSIGWSDLGELQREFAAVGMATEYGGPHSSGQTHMSLLGFPDGSYIELISTMKAKAKTEIWKKQIENDGGPCAWCVQSDDIAGEVTKAKGLGIEASGPLDYSRRRPDGTMVEWQLGFLGEGEAGSTLPFLIKDKTPRSFRVAPSPSVSGAGSPMSGVGFVLLAVKDMGATTDLFRRFYGWPEPQTDIGAMEGVTLGWFKDTPVVLATPRRPGWLSERLAAFGASPCGFLLEVSDLVEARRRFPLAPGVPWFNGREVSWIRPLKEKRIMLGTISA